MPSRRVILYEWLSAHLRLETARLLTTVTCAFLMALFTVQGTAQTWSQLTTSGAPPAQGGYTVYDRANNRLILFIPGNNLNQVWVLTNANGLGGTALWMRLQPTGTPPAGNGGGATVYDPNTNQLIYYGGCSANCGSALDAVYLLSNANGLNGTPSWSQSSVTPSFPRASPHTVYNASTKRMIAFGGNLAFFGTAQNDTRVLVNANSASSTWTTLHPTGGPPGVRTNGTAVYDPFNNFMIVFGGTDLANSSSLNDYNDFWTLSNADGSGSGTSTWTKIIPEGHPPVGRRIHAAVYDPGHDAMYVFGGLQDGSNNSVLGDLWRLSNANGLRRSEPRWDQIGQRGTSPGGSYGHSIHFDVVNERIIFYDGSIRGVNQGNQVFILDLLQR